MSTDTHSIDDRVHEVLDNLYEAVSEPACWTGALDSMALLFGAESANFFHWNDQAKALFAGQRSSSFGVLHSEWGYYHQINPRRRILQKLPAGTPINCVDYIDDRDVSRSEYFTDYSLPQGRRYLLGVNPVKHRSLTSAFAVMRTPDQAPFTSEQTRLLAHLVPHLSRIARLDLKMRQARMDGDLTGAALDRLADAIFVTDWRGLIVRANAAAQAMLNERGVLRSRYGRLQAAQPRQSTMLKGFIAAAALPARAVSGTAGGTMLIDVGKGRRWSVAVSPLMPSARLFDLADRRLAMIVVSEIVVRAPLEEQLRQAFALTMAEARVARRVIAGVTLEEIASELHVKISTLRTQLKSVFAKTETKRQGELMQLGARLDRLREV